MNDHFDRLENRTPAARESALFRDLRHVLSIARSRAPALRAQLRGIDPGKLTSRADLALVPLRRPAEIAALQAESPPFGGLAATRFGALGSAFVTPGAQLAVAGTAKDWWGMGRALFAAGLRKGVPLVNCFSYDLSPLGHMIESGARAIGSPVVPAGNADVDRIAEATMRLKPRFFCGTAQRLKDLLDHAASKTADVSCLEAALVAGFLSKGLRHELHLRGLRVSQALVLPELGVLAFESGAEDGLVVNEGLIVEIIDPVSRQPVPTAAEGELVVTRLNPDYPLLRYATGLRSKHLPAASACGRTNMRIAPPREMTPVLVHLDGASVHISQIREIAARHPEAGRMRAVTRRPLDRDEIVLEVEHEGDAPSLNERLRETLRQITRIAGTVELVSPGTLSEDEAMIVDERPLN